LACPARFERATYALEALQWAKQIEVNLVCGLTKS
jgi:hypothetical protein